MKKQAIIFVMLFFVSLFLAPNVSAFYGLQQIITGKFEAYESWDPMSPDPVLTARVSVVGSADISPSGSLETSNAIPETDQETINDAFTGATFQETKNKTYWKPTKNETKQIKPVADLKSEPCFYQ